MKIELSSRVIKAFRKKSGFISFHLTGHLFIGTNASFSITAYLKNISSFFILPNGIRVEFDSVGISEWSDIPFDGKMMVHGIYLSSISNLTAVKACIADLTIKHCFSFTGHPLENETEIYNRKVLIRKYF